MQAERDCADGALQDITHAHIPNCPTPHLAPLLPTIYHGYTTEAHFITLVQGVSQRHTMYTEMYTTLCRPCGTPYKVTSHSKFTKYLVADHIIQHCSTLGHATLNTLRHSVTGLHNWYITLVCQWWMDWGIALFQRMLQHAC